jgi:hypothetical protein
MEVAGVVASPAGIEGKVEWGTDEAYKRLWPAEMGVGIEGMTLDR